MIGYIEGEVIFCDTESAIIKLQNGIGMEVISTQLFTLGKFVKLYLSHIVREDSETLFAFNSLSEKKYFELLLKVNGVGPKTAYQLIAQLGEDKLTHAILFEDKKTLCSVSGIGPKTAAQILLDLGPKLAKNKIPKAQSANVLFNEEHSFESKSLVIIHEAILACKELGFREDIIMPVAQKIMSEREIKKSEQLVQMLLKEI